MGGPGSGTWYRWQGRKSTVEESLVLAVGYLTRRRRLVVSQTLTWRSSRGRKASISYTASFGANAKVVLNYSRGRKAIRIEVPFVFQPTSFNGERVWFTCPLIVGGVACNRRCGKLYLPPGARYFGCRKCHDLAYRGSHEAHWPKWRYTGNGRSVGPGSIRASRARPLRPLRPSGGSRGLGSGGSAAGGRYRTGAGASPGSR